MALYFVEYVLGAYLHPLDFRVDLFRYQVHHSNVSAPGLALHGAEGGKERDGKHKAHNIEHCPLYFPRKPVGKR